MNPIRRPLAAVEDWFFAPQPLDTLIVARLLLGCVLVGAATGDLFHLDLVYGPRSMAWFAPYRLSLGPQGAGPLEPLIHALAGLSNGTLRIVVWSLALLRLVSGAAFFAGAFTRTSGLLALATHLFFWTLNPDVTWGWAIMLQPFLLYAILGRSGARRSVDAWRRRRRAARRGIPADEPTHASGWPIRLMQMHCAAMYAVAGWSRIDHPGWRSGQMLIAALTHATFSRLPIDWRPFAGWLTPLSFAVFALEPLAPIALWIPRLGKWFALALIAMHAGLELLTNVGWWNFVMLVPLVTFLPVEWLPRGLRLTRAPHDPREVQAPR